MNIETDLKAVSQNLNTYSDGFKVLRTIASLFRTYKPMAFFGVIALILAVLGVGFMIPVLVEFNHTGLVERFPTLIVCCFVILAAMVSFFGTATPDDHAKEPPGF